MSEMAPAFIKVKMIFPADSNQNNSTADVKYSSGFYFPSGHWALWWFNSNLRDPTTGFIFLLLSTSWSMWLHTASIVAH